MFVAFGAVERTGGTPFREEVPKLLTSPELRRSREPEFRRGGPGTPSDRGPFRLEICTENHANYCGLPKWHGADGPWANDLRRFPRAPDHHLRSGERLTRRKLNQNFWLERGFLVLVFVDGGRRGRGFEQRDCGLIDEREFGLDGLVMSQVRAAFHSFFRIDG